MTKGEVRRAFSSRLLQAMNAKDMSAARLAREIGAHPNTVENYTKGITVPSAHMLAEMARTLGVSTDYLLAMDEEGKR